MIHTDRLTEQEVIEAFTKLAERYSKECLIEATDYTDFNVYDDYLAVLKHIQINGLILSNFVEVTPPNNNLSTYIINIEKNNRIYKIYMHFDIVCGDIEDLNYFEISEDCNDKIKTR